MSHIHIKPTNLTNLYLPCKDTGIHVKANLDSRVYVMILIPPSDKVSLYIHWCKYGLIFMLTILKCTQHQYFTAGHVATSEIHQLLYYFA